MTDRRRPAFTPGPWDIRAGFLVSGHESCPIGKWEGNNFHFIAKGMMGEDGLTETQMANIHLITAAPDMFNALQLALAVIEKSGIIWMGEDKARAALAKALGQ